MNPPPGDFKDRESMLDLPLRPSGVQADLPLVSDLRASESKATPRRPQPPSRPSRGRWLIGLAAMAILVFVAYWVFWPKPASPSFSADPFDLEQVRVGAVGEPQTLTVTNVGERPMPIEMLGVVGSEESEFALVDDTCGGTNLQPTESCTAEIRLAPSAMGPRQAVLELHADMPDSPAQLALTGEGTAPLMNVDPPVARFGPQDVGTTSQSIDLSVINEGTASLQISRVALGGTDERDFRLTRNDCSKSTLEPGESCGLRMAFAPRAAGAREAELVIVSDALEPELGVQLEGEGVWTGAAFEVEPRAIDFGRHLVGTGSRSQRLQVVNRQATTLRNIRIELTDADRGFSIGEQSCRGAALAPGASCRIEVQFAAAGEGQVSSLLEIGQADVGTLGVELQGRGVAPRWVLAVKALQFGEVRVGNASETQGVSLRNEGSAGASVKRVELTGADAAAFKTASDDCSGSDVQPGAGCALGVQFRPQREGEHRAEMSFHLEAAASPQRVSLAARAIAPRLSLDMEMVNFDRVHRTTRRQTELTVASRGTAPVRLGPFSIAGDAAASFQILGGTCLSRESLPARDQCTLVVGFSPTADGRATARLEIGHDGISGPRSLALVGIGLPPPIPKIILEVATLEFGPQPIGQRSSIQTINLRAGGTGSLELREFLLEGENPGDFNLVPATCHAAPTLRPGSDCSVGIRFVPTAAGRRSARLVIKHNASSGADAIELTGEGLGSPPS